MYVYGRACTWSGPRSVVLPSYLGRVRLRDRVRIRLGVRVGVRVRVRVAVRIAVRVRAWTWVRVRVRVRVRVLPSYLRGPVYEEVPYILSPPYLP